jgi:GTP-binding protein
VVGRPNVGKSTLVNRLLGEDRVVVFDEAGTTRDSIYIPYEREGKAYTIIDTAGVRRRGKVKEAVEKFSIIKTLEAISNANVVILMIDAREGIVDQDLHLLSHILDAGRALIFAVNKWDGTDLEQKNFIKRELERRLVFINFAKTHFISALHGSGVGNLYQSIHKAYESATRKLKTPLLNEILNDALRDHQPPLVKGRRIKLRYAHVGGNNPPIIVIHGNQTESVPNAYRRYLQRRFTDALKLEGTPIRFEFKTADNPFKGRKNKLTKRQISSKRRLIKHVKKKEKKKKS